MTRARDLATLPQEIAVDSSGRVQINGATGTYVANIADASNAFLGYKAGSNSPMVVEQDSNGDGYVLNLQNATLRLGTNNTESVRINADGSMTMKIAAGIGYGSGSGGTVTQATSKSTAVTLNKPTGQITMNAAALAAGASASFSFFSSLLTATDTLLVNGVGPISMGYRVEALYMTSGGALIRVTNVSGGSLSEALQINFAIIKGATA